uniref:(northern house mosquito) hypothetical protein n=1 Tax=Culex pipiens TaxID=7175 RepID=A0A8D8H6Y0_CULPI
MLCFLVSELFASSSFLLRSLLLMFLTVLPSRALSPTQPQQATTKKNPCQFHRKPMRTVPVRAETQTTTPGDTSGTRGALFRADLMRKSAFFERIFVAKRSPTANTFVTGTHTTGTFV